jgi:hypothetical protein
VFFYLPHLLHKFLPWSAVLVGLALVDLRSRRWSLRAAFKEMSPETLWLISWSVGGIILMSLIPSKRVDRIFPVIPPLCLLVGVQTASFLRDKNRRSSKWIVATLIVAIVFSGGYAASRIVGGYRNNRDALSIFGRQVREEAAKNGWRYEVIGKSDEGLPLYLMRPHFLKPDAAIAKWSAGEIDALAVPVDQVPQLIGQLQGAAPRFESGTRKELKRPNYVFLTR